MTVFDQVGSELAAELDAVRHSAKELAREMPGPLARLRVSSGQTVVELEWARGPAAPALAGSAPDGTAPAEAPASRDTPDTDQGKIMLTAPLVGTFYHGSEPGAPPFVSVGDMVEPGQTIGILEAMKLMNPVAADHGGQVVEILVPDATPVEFAQPLIAIAAAHEG
jgi:acetyl-CoA carboxylase biotin carboxyl carrier protein